MSSLVLFILFFSSLSFADGEKSLFEKTLERDNSISSEESWVEIKGTRFRKYEIKGGTYYVHFRDGKSKVADVYCQPPEGFKQERLVVEQPRSEHRSQAFVRAFNESCSAGGKKKAELRLNPAIGLEYPDASMMKE